jgi:dihydroxy-acid dehydratase
MSTNGDARLRSARWFSPRDLTGFVHRTAIQAEGISQYALSGRPVVGICNSWSELVNCRPAVCRSSSRPSLSARAS